jgi:Tol biopolymer transport system component
MIHTFFVQPNVCRPSKLRIQRLVRMRYPVNMNWRLAAGGMAVLFFAASATAQQVVFSRRVYTIHGRSFQQLWVWSPSGRKLEPLTRSAQNHERPTCSADGQQVFFTSGAGHCHTASDSGHRQ